MTTGRLAKLEEFIASRPRCWIGLMLLVLLAVILNHAWVTEDAYITFRSVENLHAGHGPRWNPHERVQVFTHPLWFGALSLGRFLHGELYAIALLAGVTLSLAAASVLLRTLEWRPDRSALLIALLVSSKAWVDYSTSGLENSLSYLLLGGFLVAARRLLDPGEPSSTRTALGVFLLFFLLALNRHDTITLTLPIALVALWKETGRVGTARAVAVAALASLPFLIWTVYSLVYFGFPIPNTAYAKLNTGLPIILLARQGAAYLWNSLRWDTITLVAIACALVLCGRQKGLFWRAAAAGLIANLLYVVKIGGGFMSGRFLTLAFLMAAFVVVHLAGPRLCRTFAVGMLLFAILSPLHPLRPAAALRGLDEAGIADEKGYYFEQTSIWRCLQRLGSGDPCVDGRLMREAVAARDRPERVLLSKRVGIMGYVVDREKIIIDRYAVADPLLARLPVVEYHRIGHFRRDIPMGYPESVATRQNQIQDARIREFYGQIRLITQGPLFTRERWLAIWKMNTGQFDDLVFSRDAAAQLGNRRSSDRPAAEPGPLDVSALYPSAPTHP